MKAEAYLARIIRREFKKPATESKRLAHRVAESKLVRAIQEGPESMATEKKSYAT